MNARRIMATIAVAWLASGCAATMTSEPLTPEGPREGIGYVLPYTNWSVSLAWRVDYCPDWMNQTANNGKNASMAVKVEAVAGSADDSELMFLVDPQDLQTLTSITAFAAEWHEGRNVLSSINASVEDRTGQVVGNVVKTVVKAAPLLAAAPLGAPLPPGAAPAATIFCKPETREALATARTARALVQTRAQQLEAKTRALAALSDKVAAMGAAIDDATRMALGAALDDVVNARSNLLSAEEALEDALEAISFRLKLTWPESGNVFRGGPFSVDSKLLRGWFSTGPDSAGAWQEFSSAIPLPLSDVYLQIERLGQFGRDPTAEASKDGAVYRAPGPRSKGLRYRMPARGLLVACSHSPCSSANPTIKLAQFEGPVAQLGFVNVLPFRSRMFGNNSFSVEMNIDGSLKSVGYEQKAAPAEGASGTVAGAMGELADALDPTARLKSDTAYLTALKERRDALEALREPDQVAAETSALGAETSLLNARLARLQAEIALERLRSSGRD